MNRYIPSPKELENSRIEKEKKEVAIGLTEIQKQKYHNKLLDAIEKEQKYLNVRFYGKMTYTKEMAQIVFSEWLKPYEERGWIFYICRGLNYGPPIDIEPYWIFISTEPTGFTLYFYKDHMKFIDLNCIYATTQKIYKSEACVICHEKSPEIYYVACGHLCICKDCKKTATCPLCRQMSGQHPYTTDKERFSILVENKK